jgi:hypothetical protein
MDRKNSTSATLFKDCTSCNVSWITHEIFLSDPDIEIIGYQVNYKYLQLGYFLFNHSPCKTTFSIPAGVFKHLYNNKPVYKERLTNTEACPEYCLNDSDLRPCPNKCECSYVREIIQIIKKWNKLERSTIKR